MPIDITQLWNKPKEPKTDNIVTDSIIGFVPGVSTVVDAAHTYGEIKAAPKDPWSYLGLAASVIPGISSKNIKRAIKKVRGKKYEVRGSNDLNFPQNADIDELAKSDSGMVDRLRPAVLDNKKGTLSSGMEPGIIHSHLHDSFDYTDVHDGFYDPKTKTYFDRQQAARLIGKQVSFLPDEGVGILDSEVLREFQILDGLYSGQLKRSKESVGILQTAIREGRDVDAREFKMLKKELGEAEAEEFSEALDRYRAYHQQTMDPGDFERITSQFD